ncbi:hypothetical protein [Photobacterium damselae]|uniref:hypothetical protein n=1 Tax=Photobacterium damselae TaxID=38293 RepID=UPI00107637E9|nr:hypothetical protein [Photobacterium damselae]MBE8127752.1 hypothetical protein [Photobacterium damselae subsp. piscicida]TLS88317.1 hypothetical protein FD720_05665 [Photobacterium damselae subsp. damselae]WIH22014.1 hypothetical protein KQY33_20280 [Photobacterium damselae]
MLGLISAGISAVGSAIGSACSAIGGAVVSTGKVMIDAISRGLPIVEKVCDIAFTVGKEVGIFSPTHTERDMYELGMRAEGIDSEQFDNNKAFIEHIREKVELSKERLEQLDNLSDGDKLKYAAIGSAVTIAAIKEQYKIDIPNTFWLTGAEIGIRSEQVKPMLDEFETARLKPDLDGFLKGELSSDLHSNIYDLIDNKLDDLLNDEVMDKLLC